MEVSCIAHLFVKISSAGGTCEDERVVWFTTHVTGARNGNNHVRVDIEIHFASLQVSKV